MVDYFFFKSNKTWNNNVRIIRAPSFPEFMAWRTPTNSQVASSQLVHIDLKS